MGTLGNEGTSEGEISANGRWVVFTSSASNLIPDDTNGVRDVFVHDLQTGATVRVIGANDSPACDSFGPRISADGRIVLAQSCDRTAYPFIGSSASSTLGGLVIHNRDVSGSGVFDVPGNTSDMPVPMLMEPSCPAGWSDYSLSSDGRWLAFLDGRLNPAEDCTASNSASSTGVFVYDLNSNDPANTVQVAVTPNGDRIPNITGANPYISGTGQFVGFMASFANVFLHDRDVGQTGTFDTPGNILTSPINVSPQVANLAGNDGPGVDDGGRYVLLNARTGSYSQIGLHAFDRVTGTDSFVQIRPDGAEFFSNGIAYGAVISGDGQTIAYTAIIPQLIPGDTSNLEEIYVARIGAINDTTTLNVTPTTLNFGSLTATLSTSPQRATLQNTGVPPAVIGQLVAPASFVISNDACSNAFLLPEHSCTFDIAFSPATTGDFNANLAIPYNGVAQTVTLMGTGLPVELSAPKERSYGKRAVDTVSHRKKIKLTNKSPVTVQMGVPDVPPDFEISTDGCTGIALAPKSHCAVYINFAPISGSSGDVNEVFSYPFTYGSNVGDVSVSLTGKVKS